MMENIAFRRGVGDILAHGIVLAAKKFGKEANKGSIIAGLVGVQVNFKRPDLFVLGLLRYQ